MHYVVYIDVLFIVNLGMNVVVLALAGRLLRKPHGWIRKLLGGLVGALLYCLKLVVAVLQGMPLSAVYDILTSVCMVLVAYRLMSIREFLRSVVVLYVTAFFLGGAIQGIYSYTKVGYYIREGIRQGRAMNVWMFVVLTAGSCALLKLGISWYWNRESRTHYTIMLEKDGKKITADGLMDTGNSLREPVSGKPVMVVNLELIKELYDEEKEIEIKKFYEDKNAGTNGMHLIPYHTIEGDGLMAGFCLDSAIIIDGDSYVRITRPYVAVSPESVNKKKRFQVLLQPDFFKPL